MKGRKKQPKRGHGDRYVRGLEGNQEYREEKERGVGSFVALRSITLLAQGQFYKFRK